MRLSCSLLICPLAVRLLGLKEVCNPKLFVPLKALRGSLGGFPGLSLFMLKIN
jgi:hypothetical protein